MIDYKAWHKEANGGYGAVTYSRLSRMYRSNARALSYQTQYKKSTELVFGIYLHTLLLEPHKIQSQYIIEDYKASRRQQIIDSGLTRINQRGDNSHDLAVSMIRSLRAHQAASWLLRDTQSETPVDAVFNGLQVKALLDCVKLITDKNGDQWVYISDIKTISDRHTITDDALSRHIVSCHYHLQASVFMRTAAIHYNVPLERVKYFLVFVEKEPYYRGNDEHHGIIALEVTGDMLDAGHGECDALMARFKRCVDANHFDDYPDDFKTVDLPTWYQPID
jgi:hypothetical protein